MYLGGIPGAGLLLPVYNAGSTTIARGCCASLFRDADRDYGSGKLIDFGQGYGAGPTFVLPVRNWVTSTQDEPIGITAKAIPAGEHGIVCIFGACLVKTDGNVEYNDELTLSTGGILIPDPGSAVIYAKALCNDFTEPTVLDYGTASATFALAFVSFNTSAAALPS